jgi:hypothetical protein
MGKTNWQLVDRDTFAEFRFSTASEIAQAYFTESVADTPDDTRLISMYEIGQSRFSEHLNNRIAREQLFFNMVKTAYLTATN